MKSLAISIALALVALAPIPSDAQATTTLVGSPLTAFSGTFNLSGCPPGASCTIAPRILPSATVVSPIDGVIVRWHLLGANSTNFNLQVLSFVGIGPSSDGSEPEYKSLRTSAAMKPQGRGLETFTTALPITAGQTIGLKMEPNGEVAEVPTVGARLTIFSPSLADGTPQAGKNSAMDHELAFNAEIQPAPTLRAITPTKGPLAGGNAVTMEGTQFADVKEVTFGAVPARSFAVDSEGKITAVAPAVSAAATVPVSVTTVAGTATLPQAYAYEKTAQEEAAEKMREEEERRKQEEARQQSCHVPRLRGRKLATARRLLGSAHCSLGRVRKTKGATARTGRVARQSPKPGKALAAGAKVNLVLVPRRR
jgi:hypothetical protein